jgi:simple sugar transport system substrate-binding protein
MSQEDLIHDAIERLEWDERADDSPGKKLRQFTRRSALTGGAAGIAALMLQACGSSGSSSSSSSSASSSITGTASAATGGSSSAATIFGYSKPLKFTMVNHVTTNPFFTPTQSGASDACKLLGCSYQWTGSATSSVSEMVTAINTAVTAGVNGIATTLIDPTAFNKPVQAALAAKIPVIAYNADEPQTGRLAYVGQDLLVSGQQMGDHIVTLLPSGGQIALFIATPGAANIQPRIDGAIQTLKAHPSIKYDVVATGAAVPAELTAIQAWATAHSSAKGMFAVDAGSTQSLAQTIQKQGLKAKGWVGGGYDLTPITQQLLAAGYIQFTIDQQPYLQGFLPILELYLYNASQGLTGPATVDTGLKFLDKTTVIPYNSTKSVYEGTGTQPGVQKS